MGAGWSLEGGVVDGIGHGRSPSLDGDVGEEDVLDVDVGVLLDRLEDLLLELLAPLALDQVLVRRVGQRVGDEVADDASWGIAP